MPQCETISFGESVRTARGAQDAGLIHDILPAAEIVRRIAEEAERVLTEPLPRLVTH
jgi:hypothetical protein